MRFSIYDRSRRLATWDLPTATCIYRDQLDFGGETLVAYESNDYILVLEGADTDQDYEVYIGDVPAKGRLVDAPSSKAQLLDGHRYLWPAAQYFESGRAETRVRVLWRSPGDDAVPMKPLITVPVYVVPTKLSEQAYQAMTDDLLALSRGLLLDLYGKSRRTYDLRLARESGPFHSKDEELDLLGVTVERLEALLRRIAARPCTVVERERVHAQYWGTEYLPADALQRLAQRGLDARLLERPVALVRTRLAESFDVPEHRALKAFLETLNTRLEACVRAVWKHMAAIEADRLWRDHAPRGEPSLYDTIDVPKLDRLRQALAKAAHVQQAIRAMGSLPFLEGVAPEFGPLTPGAFQRGPDYVALFHFMRSYRASSGVAYEGECLSGVTKLTSRLFEQWSFLRLVEGFRIAGLDLQDWADVLRQHINARFILDFDRGLMFEGQLTRTLRLRIRYEPWIMGLDAATSAGDTLYRSTLKQEAWSPDIVVELLRAREDRGEPLYAVVLDCKYSAALHDHHWEAHKYLGIRSTISRRQVARQVWLVLPGEEGITSDDADVGFGEEGLGVDCSVEDNFTGVLRAQPGHGAVFARFAAGTLDFFRREWD